MRETAEQAELFTAKLLLKTVQTLPDAVLGLATGRTMEPVYRAFVELACLRSVNTTSLTTFNLDEYVGVNSEHPFSFRRYMDTHLFLPLGVNSAQSHIPDGGAHDLQSECAAYEQKIKEAGGIDLQLLGIGMNGHIGFNEPGAPFDSRTRVESLTPETQRDNTDPRHGSAPSHAITMGIGTILDARRCVLLATGSRKAKIVARAVEGPPCDSIPASALQRHPHCLVVLDADAAAELARARVVPAAKGQDSLLP